MVPDTISPSEYAYTDTAGAVSVKQTQHLSSTLNQDRYTYLDGFGQTVQERVEAGVNGGKWCQVPFLI